MSNSLGCSRTRRSEMEEPSAEEWLASFAEAIGGEAPDRELTGRLLKLAAVAAHSSERIAAPVACWVAASAGVDIERAITAAESIGES
jgi:hypothetical protein